MEDSSKESDSVQETLDELKDLLDSMMLRVPEVVEDSK